MNETVRDRARCLGNLLSRQNSMLEICYARRKLIKHHLRGRRLGYESVSGLQVRQLNWREYCTCYFVRT